MNRMMSHQQQQQQQQQQRLITLYTCYICRQIVQGDVRGLFCHLRTIHFVCELPSVTLKCGQGDCVRCYSTFNSLAAHLRAKHRDPCLLYTSPSPRDS